MNQKVKTEMRDGVVVNIVVENNFGTLKDKIIDFVEDIFMKEPRAKGIQIQVIVDEFRSKGVPVTPLYVAKCLKSAGYITKRGVNGRSFVVKKVAEEQ